MDKQKLELDRNLDKQKLGLGRNHNLHQGLLMGMGKRENGSIGSKGTNFNNNEDDFESLIPF